jgi:ATP-dependent DNA helicase PIF1
LRDSYLHGYLQGRLRKNRGSGITRYILDEVSMLEAAQLSLLVKAMEDLNNEGAVLGGDEPEIGMTLVGDFLQLPPVQGDFAFQAPEWEEYFAPNVQTMTQIHRQADPTFIAALRALRLGDADAALAGLRHNFVAHAEIDFDGSSIYSKNLQVDRYNKLRHEKLTTTPITFTTVQTLSLDKDGKEIKPPADWKQIPAEVTLKPGALVMILANKTIRHDEEDTDPYIVYANGDLGEFLGTVEGQPNTAVVRLRRTGREVNVAFNLRQHKRATGKKGVRAEAWTILGEIRYMPLRLAYATTVHKSQGLTLDKVQLDIADPFWAAPAMLYVGVSRARSLEGLRIVGRPEMLQHRCKSDPRVARWR